MAIIKTALLSPAVNQMQAPVSGEEAQQLFEDKFSQMAYRTFEVKHPDVSANIITFKMLDTDMDTGSAVGAFILETGGEYIYVPVVLATNQLKPFDLMYIKSKDMFLPLSDAWLTEVQKTTLNSLGSGTTLKDVATDVDIRSLVTPPMTGRNSYASDQSQRLAASTEKLGRYLTKVAIGPFPGGAEGAAAIEQGFNPELWATFNEQYQRIAGMSPGQALDSGQVDLDALSKMYKSHLKTWEATQPDTPPQQSNQSLADAAMPQPQGADMAQPDPSQGMPPMQPKMANAGRAAIDMVDERAGDAFNRYMSYLGQGAATGGAAGGLLAAKDMELADVPNAVFRGAIGGSIGALPGRAATRALARRAPHLFGSKPSQFDDIDAMTRMFNRADAAGTMAGGAMGGVIMQRSDPRLISQMTAPSDVVMQEYYQEHPQMMQRYASDQSAGLLNMVKSASRAVTHQLDASRFLASAPNHVKIAFSHVLQRNPRLLKIAADRYGVNTLTSALHPVKAASATPVLDFFIAHPGTDAATLKAVFDKQASEAYQGVLTRGYHYLDNRKMLKAAMLTEEPKQYEDARSCGVYTIYKVSGGTDTALVIPFPLDLFEDDRATYPKNTDKVTPIINKVTRDTADREPHSMSAYELTHGVDTVHRSHKVPRLVVLNSGAWFKTSKLVGTSTSTAAKDAVNNKVLRAIARKKGTKPSTGTGIFVTMKGGAILSTKPVKVTNVTTKTNGDTTCSLESQGGFSKATLVIPKAKALSNPVRIREKSLVLMPSTWTWVPLADKADANQYVDTASTMHKVALSTLMKAGAVSVTVKDATQGMYAVDNLAPMSKVAALNHIAMHYGVHAYTAEAMLKVAQHTRVCRALVVSPQALIKTAQQPPISQGYPVQPAPQGMQPPESAPPEEPMQSPVELAFEEQLQGLQQQMQTLQQTMGALMSVQQRAQEIALEQQGIDPATVQQGGDPSMQGQMQGGDPSMQGQMQGQGGDPAMDPAMQQEPPPPAIMRTETPSYQEVEQQVNPAFLEQAGELQETGAFDAGVISSLSQNSDMKALGAEFTPGLEKSLDDVGRTLLTLYMRESELKDQLGDTEFVALEDKLRNTLKTLGGLVLSLSQNTTMLPT